MNSYFKGQSLVRVGPRRQPGARPKAPIPNEKGGPKTAFSINISARPIRTCSGLGHRGHFGREIAFLLFNALTQAIAEETLQRDRSAGGLGGFEPASAAATLLSKSATRLLDIELSALESDGQGKILSNPRIMTADMVKATIEQGTELPYQTSSSNGGNKIQFRKANLRLEVIPKIHHDGKVSLLVAINKDSVGMKTEQGYAIDTKNLSSEVTVENGGTVILGGIYQTTERDDLVKVPFLGDIPLIGNLFKHQAKLRDKTELLVFLTPTILDKPE